MFGSKLSQKKPGRGLRPLDERGGGTLLVYVFMIFSFTLALYLTFMNTVRDQRRLASGNKDETVAMQLADSAMDQVLGKIRGHKIIIPLEYVPSPTPTPMGQTAIPVTFTVPVGDGKHSATAYARLDFVRDSSNVPIRDLEGNLKYRIETVVTLTTGTGTKGRVNIRRGVKADFIIVNFARYMSYMFGNDAKSFAGKSFNGPYHCNGSVTMNTDADWNNSKISFGGATVVNPFYDSSYTTVVAGSFVNGGSMNYRTQNNQTAYESSNGSYNILANNGSPINGPCTTGTWLDGAHGGFVVAPVSIPSNEFSSLAHVILQTSLLYDSQQYQRQSQGGVSYAFTGTTGAITIAGNQLINSGVTNVSPSLWPVRVNLNALNKGSSSSVSLNVFGEVLAGDGYLGDNDTDAATNYNKALASPNGLVIFVEGDAAVWGMLPAASGVTNTNKKVTIICTGSAQLVGDVLVSSSRYVTAGAGVWSSDDIDPNPLVDNPNNDCIAILAASGNMNVNPWRANNPRFFWNESGGVNTSGAACSGGGDMRIDAFLYAPGGATQGNNSTQTYTTVASGTGTGNGSINHFTFHGAIAANTSRSLPSCTYDRFYDPRMKYNVSGIVPSATSLTSWLEDIDPPVMP